MDSYGIDSHPPEGATIGVHFWWVTVTREHLFWNHGSFGVQSIPEVFHEIPVKKEFLSLIRKLPFFWQLFLNCHFKKLLKSKNAIQHDQISTKKQQHTREKCRLSSWHLVFFTTWTPRHSFWVWFWLLLLHRRKQNPNVWWVKSLPLALSSRMPRDVLTSRGGSGTPENRWLEY